MGLGINSTKTKLVPFTKRIELPNLRTISLNGVKIEWKIKVKYLGLIQDKTLLWKRHVEPIVGKANGGNMGLSPTDSKLDVHHNS